MYHSQPVNILTLCTSNSTHSTDAWCEVLPAPFDEEDGLVSNHVLDVQIKPVAT